VSQLHCFKLEVFLYIILNVYGDDDDDATHSYHLPSLFIVSLCAQNLPFYKKNLIFRLFHHSFFLFVGLISRLDRLIPAFFDHQFLVLFHSGFSYWSRGHTKLASSLVSYVTFVMRFNI